MVSSSGLDDPIIRFENVTKRFGDFTAVDSLSLDLHAGKFIAMMGPSGCGKTTTLRMLAGLDSPSSGEIWFNGQRISRQKPWERNMPLVWQSLALFPFLNVLDNVTFGLKMARIPAAERTARALTWLKRLDIHQLASSQTSKISGGQAQRVALARALVMEPKVLLLDEPLSALDAHLVVRMQAELTKLQRELGITFLYVTHNQSEAFAMADRVVIMNKGRIQQNGTPKDVFRAPANRFVADFVGMNNILRGKLLAGSVEEASVETPVGRLPARACEDRRVALGSTVDLVVSADMIRVSLQPPDAVPAIPVTLISEQFVGTTVTLHTEMSDKRLLRVQMRQHEFEDLDIFKGARLYVSWRAKDALLLLVDD